MDNVQYSIEAERIVIFIILLTNEIASLLERKFLPEILQNVNTRYELMAVHPKNGKIFNCICNNLCMLHEIKSKWDFYSFFLIKISCDL